MKKRLQLLGAWALVAALPVLATAQTVQVGQVSGEVTDATGGMLPRGAEWRSVLAIGAPNMLGWHTMSILGVKELASGRAAILGFTMPIWTVLISVLFLGERLTRRVAVAAVAVAVAIRAPGFRPDDNYLHLEPGRPRLVRLDPDGSGAREFVGTVEALNGVGPVPIEVGAS